MTKPAQPALSDQDAHALSVMTNESAGLEMLISSTNEITDLEEFRVAAESLLMVKGRIKNLDTRRKTLTKPAKDLAAAVGELFDPPTKAYQMVEARLKALIGDFVDRRLPEAVVEAQAAAARGDRDALAAAMRPIPMVAGLSLRTATEVEVLDESLVPERFFTREVDMVALRAAVRAGEIVPGTRKTERTQVAVSAGTEGAT